MEPLMFFLSLVLLLFVLAITYSVFVEIEIWNKGVCAKNNIPWALFDVDPQGGRMYRAGAEQCCITWLGVDKR